MRLIVLTLLVSLVCIASTKAHGDLDLRIEAISSVIVSFPDSAALYFHRGKLKFQHEEYKAAITDIHTSIQKGFHDELQKIYLAKSLFKLKKFKEASIDLNDFLNDDPDNVVGLNLKGRILYAQQDFEASALSFEKVIQLSFRSLPENYLEAARSWSRSTLSNRYEKIVNVLELGLKNLGPIVTLQNKLIETHLQEKKGEEAINLQLAIIDKSRRKESAYFKLAKIYLDLEKPDEAKKAAYNSKIHLEKLPSRIRKNSAMKSLENEIQQLINNIQ